MHMYIAVHNSYVLSGTRERELGNRSRELLEQGGIFNNLDNIPMILTYIAEAKQREAMRKEREADDNERMVKMKII